VFFRWLRGHPLTLAHIGLRLGAKESEL